MDSAINATLDWLVRSTGLAGPALIALMIFTSLGCQLLGRLIPDDATGWRKYVRIVAKVLGLYVSNRISSGTSVADVAKAVVESEVPARDVTGRYSNVANVLKVKK